MLPDLPGVDSGRGRLGVDDGVQEGVVAVVRQRVEGDPIDGRQGERVETRQVKEPVAANHTGKNGANFFLDRVTSLVCRKLH